MKQDRTWSMQEHKMFSEWKDSFDLENETDLTRKAFVCSDDLVSSAGAWIANNHKVTLSGYEIRDLSQSVERACYWKVPAEEYGMSKEIALENAREFGCRSGEKGVRGRIKNAAKASRRIPSKGLRSYYESPAWKTRRKRFLVEHCLEDDGKFHCKLCSKGHVDGIGLQVHHNRYGLLDGKEPDAWLVGLCEGFCHDSGDVARRLESGAISTAQVNDCLRPMFPQCPHGEEHAECEACMRESDYAYDSNREDRFYGKF